MGKKGTALLSAIAGTGLVAAVVIPNLIVPTEQAKATERTAALPLPEWHTRQVFQKTIAVTPSSDASVQTGALVVPSGKRLVIEYVAGVGPRPAHDITLLTSVNGSQGQYPLTQHQNPVTGKWTISQPARVYADAGTPVRVVAAGAPKDGGGPLLITLSGYLADVS